jgi:hypothetical protein
VKRSAIGHFGSVIRGGLRFAPPALLLLAGCAEVTATQTYACLLPSEERMLVAELFFGRNIAGRGPLTDAEWHAFAAEIVTPNFPDGFTVFDGEGQWRNPASGRIAQDPTKILLVAAKRAPSLAARLAAVIEAYKTRFRQQSVGIITRDSCAAF